MKLYVKNMVCDRCKLAVAATLRELNLPVVSLELGEIVFADPLPGAEQIEKLTAKLEPLGFEIIGDRKSRLIERIKVLVIDLIQRRDEFTQIKLSDFLSGDLHYDYTYLSNLFSAVEGITIEQYLIQQRIEKVKELLVYGEANLTEISQQMAYSSVGHLSRQFKKVTGMTPSQFKQLRDPKKRKPLDKVGIV